MTWTIKILFTIDLIIFLNLIMQLSLLDIVNYIFSLKTTSIVKISWIIYISKEMT